MKNINNILFAIFIVIILTINVNASTTVISFIDPTPVDNIINTTREVFVNTSVMSDDNNLTAFINWNDSLLRWMQLNEASGNVAQDNSGHNNGTLHNMNSGLNNCTGKCSGWTSSGKYGNALNFDGVNDYVDLGPLITRGITVELWVKTTDTKAFQFPIGIGNTSSVGWRLQIENGNRTKFYVYNSTTGMSISQSHRFTNGAWTHLVGTYNGKKMSLYTDGVLGGSKSLIEDINYVGARNLWIGQINGTGGSNTRYFNGTIDEVRVYSRALSAEEVAASYNASKNRLYHNFNNQSAYELGYGNSSYQAFVQDSAGMVNKTEIRNVNMAWPALTYTILIPPAPTLVTTNQDNFWINRTWQAGTGNGTDSYNVSVNGIWKNGTTITYNNSSVPPHGWSNITVWAYNNSGSLSQSPATQDTQVTNNAPVQLAIGNKTVIAGNVLAFTVFATDADSDPISYSTNAAKGTINHATGEYFWRTTTSDAGTYVWTFSSRDNYGGVVSETIEVIVSNRQGVWINLKNNSGELTVNDSSSLDNGTGLSSATWSIWAIQNNYTSNAGLFGKYQPIAGNRSYVIRTSNLDGISIMLSADGTNATSYSSNTNRDCGIRNNNEWTLITVTYDSSKIVYYRNGVRCDSDSSTISSIRNSPASLRIGGGNGIFFNGSIDETIMYNKGLPGHQVYRFYQESDHGLAGKQTIPVLVYHQVTDPADTSDKISINDFNQQIAYLHDNNFTTITAENFSQWQKGNFTMPKRPVIIFFDDGWNYTYNNVLPTFEQYDFVGVIPVVTKYANFTNDISYMRWWQLLELQKKGWEIASHSIDHVSMLTLDKTALRDELNISSNVFMNKLGRRPTSFIFPSHLSNATYTAICGEYYDLCWTYGSSDISPKYTDYSNDGHVYQSLKRITIYNTTTMKTFKDMFARELYVPVGAWPLNEGTGSIAHDDSGNGNDAFLNANATWQFPAVLG